MLLCLLCNGQLFSRDCACTCGLRIPSGGVPEWRSSWSGPSLLLGKSPPADGQRDGPLVHVTRLVKGWERKGVIEDRGAGTDAQTGREEVLSCRL